VIVAVLGIIFGLLTGIAGLVLGPVAYFLGKSAISRIDESQGKLGGRSTAAAGWVMGAVATGLGAVVTLVWFILFLVILSTPAG
jgi:hypothetical protein